MKFIYYCQKTNKILAISPVLDPKLAHSYIHVNPDDLGIINSENFKSSDYVVDVVKGTRKGKIIKTSPNDFISKNKILLIPFVNRIETPEFHIIQHIKEQKIEIICPLDNRPNYIVASLNTDPSYPLWTWNFTQKNSLTFYYQGTNNFRLFTSDRYSSYGHLINLDNSHN